MGPLPHWLINQYHCCQSKIPILDKAVAQEGNSLYHHTFANLVSYGELFDDWLISVGCVVFIKN